MENPQVKTDGIREENDVIFFIYDHTAVRREEDDPKDAIIFMHPKDMSDEMQCFFCGTLMAIASYLKSTISMSVPQIISLHNYIFAVKRIRDFSYCLGSQSESSSNLLKKRLEFVCKSFIFYHRGMERLTQEFRTSSAGSMAKTLELFFTSGYFSRNRIQHGFLVLPEIELPKVVDDVFLKAACILESSQNHMGVLAGVIFHHNRVLYSQLQTDITRKLLLLKARDSNFPCMEIATGFNLPGGIRLLTVFLEDNELQKLKQRNKHKFKHESSQKFITESNRTHISDLSHGREGSYLQKAMTKLKGFNKNKVLNKPQLTFHSVTDTDRNILSKIKKKTEQDNEIGQNFIIEGLNAESNKTLNNRNIPSTDILSKVKEHYQQTNLFRDRTMPSTGDSSEPILNTSISSSSSQSCDKISESLQQKSKMKAAEAVLVDQTSKVSKLSSSDSHIHREGEEMRDGDAGDNNVIVNSHDNPLPHTSPSDDHSVLTLNHFHNNDDFEKSDDKPDVEKVNCDVRCDDNPSLHEVDYDTLPHHLDMANNNIITNSLNKRANTGLNALVEERQNHNSNSSSIASVSDGNPLDCHLIQKKLKEEDAGKSILSENDEEKKKTLNFVIQQKASGENIKEIVNNVDRTSRNQNILSEIVVDQGDNIHLVNSCDITQPKDSLGDDTNVKGDNLSIVNNLDNTLPKPDVLNGKEMDQEDDSVGVNSFDNKSPNRLNLVYENTLDHDDKTVLVNNLESTSSFHDSNSLNEKAVDFRDNSHVNSFEKSSTHEYNSLNTKIDDLEKHAKPVNNHFVNEPSSFSSSVKGDNTHPEELLSKRNDRTECEINSLCDGLDVSHQATGEILPIHDDHSSMENSSLNNIVQEGDPTSSIIPSSLSSDISIAEKDYVSDNITDVGHNTNCLLDTHQNVNDTAVKQCQDDRTQSLACVNQTLVLDTSVVCDSLVQNLPDGNTITLPKSFSVVDENDNSNSVYSVDSGSMSDVGSSPTAVASELDSSSLKSADTSTHSSVNSEVPVPSCIALSHVHSHHQPHLKGEAGDENGEGKSALPDVLPSEIQTPIGAKRDFDNHNILGESRGVVCNFIPLEMTYNKLDADSHQQNPEQYIKSNKSLSTSGLEIATDYEVSVNISAPILDSPGSDDLPSQSTTTSFSSLPGDTTSPSHASEVLEFENSRSASLFEEDTQVLYSRDSPTKKFFEQQLFNNKPHDKYEMKSECMDLDQDSSSKDDVVREGDQFTYVYDDGLNEILLYVQAHSETVMILLLDMQLKDNQQIITELWKCALPSLGDLDYCVKQNLRHIPTKSILEGHACMNYDTFLKNIKGTGSSHDLISKVRADYDEMAVTAHEIFEADSSVSEILLGSQTHNSYSQLCNATETYLDLQTNVDSNGLPLSPEVARLMDECIKKKT